MPFEELLELPLVYSAQATTPQPPLRREIVEDLAMFREFGTETRRMTTARSPAMDDA